MTTESVPPEETERRVNLFPELVALLQEFSNHLESHATFGLNEAEVGMLQRADAVLAKAKGVSIDD